MSRLLGHLKNISIHKWQVFRLCCRFGIPIQGLLHDLSKFTLLELKESVKYYTDGKRSPNDNAISDKGYSDSWNHHIRINKHHYEYWYLHKTTEEIPDMPFKYALEMFCDRVATAKIYLGINYNDSSAYDYFIVRKYRSKMGEATKNFLEEALTLLKNNGIKSLNREKLKQIYDKYVKES